MNNTTAATSKYTEKAIKEIDDSIDLLEMCVSIIEKGEDLNYIPEGMTIEQAKSEIRGLRIAKAALTII